MTTNVFNMYARYTALKGFQEHNGVINANQRLLDLVLATDGVDVTVCRCERSLVPEDPHNPFLDINLRVGGVTDVPFGSGR